MNKAIQNGIDLLTKHFGEGWQDRIDLDQLDMNHCDYCVVWQLFDDYGIAVREELRLSSAGEISHGFWTRDNSYEAWKELDREWHEYFETRKRKLAP